MQLYALRANVEAMIATVEAEAKSSAVVPGCEHPEDKRRPSNNMGEAPEYFCLDCKAFVKGQA
jgi:hypothetical protein